MNNWEESESEEMIDTKRFPFAILHMQKQQQMKPESEESSTFRNFLPPCQYKPGVPEVGLLSLFVNPSHFIYRSFQWLTLECFSE